MKSVGAFFRAIWLLLAASAVLSACATAPERKSLGEDSERPIVLMIGIDGLRWDMTGRHPAPHLQALAKRGVRAESLIPVMPTSTFPNFYALATGLYPENNGVLANATYDRELKRTFSFPDGASDAFFEGEPIWITAERQGVKAATMFWVGSEAPVEGLRPSYWFPYDRDKPHGERVAQVLGWLDMPESERPRFIALYFSAVDAAGHRFGVDSDEERAALGDVDAHVGMLLKGIEKRGLTAQVNVIVVGDHGMTDFGPERIFLDDYTDLEGAVVPALADLAYANAVNVNIFAEKALADRIYTDLKGAHEAMAVYRRGQIPERYHYRHPTRTPDIMLVPEPGWLISLRNAEPPANYVAGHGYDPKHKDMHASFIAVGPAFRSGETVDSFANIQIYSLIAGILGLEPAETDGSLEAVDHLIIK